MRKQEVTQIRKVISPKVQKRAIAHSLEKLTEFLKALKWKHSRGSVGHHLH